MDEYFWFNPLNSLWLIGIPKRLDHLCCYFALCPCLADAQYALSCDSLPETGMKMECDASCRWCKTRQHLLPSKQNTRMHITHSRSALSCSIGVSQLHLSHNSSRSASRPLKRGRDKLATCLHFFFFTGFVVASSSFVGCFLLGMKGVKLDWDDPCSSLEHVSAPGYDTSCCE